MPRNPNKRHCQSPGCNAWAMRYLPGSGKALPANHCRSHMDHILGPHRSGAPKRNLNALKTGRYALSKTGQPLSTENVEFTAHAIAKKPHQIAEILSGHIKLIHGRTGDAYLTVLILARLTALLSPLLADHRFHLELADFLETLPPAARPDMEATIWKYALPFNPFDRLKFLRGVINGMLPENNQRESNP